MIDITQFKGHTAGPWSVAPTQEVVNAAGVVLADIAGGYWWESERPPIGPNSVLMAAAPDLLAEVIRLRAALLDAATRWQPIATAPKDGTAVLVIQDTWTGLDSGRAEKCMSHNTYVAEWWPGERNGAGAWICYMDAKQDPECPVKPTHWMPLPDAPAAQEGGAA
jgi:hypothetical protein